MGFSSVSGLHLHLWRLYEHFRCILSGQESSVLDRIYTLLVARSGGTWEVKKKGGEQGREERRRWRSRKIVEGWRTDDGPPTLQMQSAVRGSPAVHTDHNNAPEKLSKEHEMGSGGKKSEVTGWGGTENEGRKEVGDKCNNLGLWELRRQIGKKINK